MELGTARCFKATEEEVAKGQVTNWRASKAPQGGTKKK